jgi:glycosyltransferase involved in cell wall biosynthesis
MKRLQVLMLTTGFPRFTGDLFGAFILEQAQALVASDVDVEVLAPHQHGLSRKEQMGGVSVRRFRYFWPASLQKVAYGGGIPTNIKQSWWARLEIPFFLLSYALSARRRAKEADLLHCHWTVSGLVAIWASGRGKTIVLSVRGSDINMLNNKWMRRLNSYIAARMDHIVAVSEDIAQKLLAGGIPGDKIHVIANGVDGRFCPADKATMRRNLDLPSEHFIVLFVGLLVPVKGLEILVDALSAWAAEKANWTCILVGDGPLSEMLQQQAIDAEIDEHMHFVGRRSSQEIPQWMQAADVLVLPSYSEGRPNVVLEAQACGTPVVATRVGGTAELVVEGETALLVESGDAAQLRAALEMLRDDPSRCEDMGRRARAHVEASGLTWEASANQLEELYRSALKAA